MVNQPFLSESSGPPCSPHDQARLASASAADDAAKATCFDQLGPTVWSGEVNRGCACPCDQGPRAVRSSAPPSAARFRSGLGPPPKQTRRAAPQAPDHVAIKTGENAGHEQRRESGVLGSKPRFHALVQGPELEPASQVSVHNGHAKRERRVRMAACLCALDLLAQSGQKDLAPGTEHALACSYSVLIRPGESIRHMVVGDAAGAASARSAARLSSASELIPGRGTRTLASPSGVADTRHMAEDPNPLIKLLVKAVRAVRAARLPRGADSKPTHNWEAFGRDLGRAVRKLRDGEKPRS
jgi:hypothetical protein